MDLPDSLIGGGGSQGGAMRLAAEGTSLYSAPWFRVGPQDVPLRVFTTPNSRCGDRRIRKLYGVFGLTEEAKNLRIRFDHALGKLRVPGLQAITCLNSLAQRIRPGGICSRLGFTLLNPPHNSINMRRVQVSLVMATTGRTLQFHLLSRDVRSLIFVFSLIVVSFASKLNQRKQDGR
jgi:hypothetical protein